MRQPVLFRSFLVLTILIFSGCASVVPDFTAPKVTLADIRVEEIKPLEAAFLIQLRVMNPNDLPLEIKGLSCDLELDGTEFASGMQGEEQVIPPYGSALVPVKVYASVLNMVSSVLQRLPSTSQPSAPQDPLTYGLEGHVRISSGGISRNLPFTSSGELNLHQTRPGR